MSKKILVALSGGVDSAVAALLLKKQGYEVSAAYMRTWMNEDGSNIFADCPWEEDLKQAKAVAKKLSIDFDVVNLIDGYRDKVVSYLVDGYKSGRTPNPDIMCNREMKFGVFQDYALNQGFDGIATGHYCRKKTNEDGTCDLFEGKDKNKDQSYFLSMVRQEQLKTAHFPVGELSKPEVRNQARDHQLPNANRKDSQGICFLGKVKINDFLAQYIPERPGDILRAGDRKKLGKHQGLHRFTLGQRKGIGIPSNTDNKNFVVVGKDYDKNQLFVAFDEEKTPGLYQKQMQIGKINWINRIIKKKTEILGKPRFRDTSQRLVFSPDSLQSGTVTFDCPQRALARGQVISFYEDEKLLGGGIYL